MGGLPVNVRAMPSPTDSQHLDNVPDTPDRIVRLLNRMTTGKSDAADEREVDEHIRSMSREIRRARCRLDGVELHDDLR